MPEPTLVSEAQFQRTVREAAVAFGWTVFTTWKSWNSPAGEPDLRLVRPPRLLFIELKSATGTLTPKQTEARYLLTQCPGVEYYLFRPDDWPAIEEVLR